MSVMEAWQTIQKMLFLTLNKRSIIQFFIRFEQSAVKFEFTDVSVESEEFVIKI